jgi:hypothetical protein
MYQLEAHNVSKMRFFILRRLLARIVIFQQFSVHVWSADCAVGRSPDKGYCNMSKSKVKVSRHATQAPREKGSRAPTHS